MNQRKKARWAALLLSLGMTLSGCVMTVEEMYCLPIRSEGYNNLQTVMDPAMDGLSHAAPVSGENQQTVQSADLDGDGEPEIILFARGNDENPLKLLVFHKENGVYSLLTQLESSGSDFDQVEYVQLDGQPGLELVVGRQISDQVLRNVTAYRMNDGSLEQLMSASYRKYLICDLDQDHLGEVLVLTGGTEETDSSIAVRYTMENGVTERSAEARLSRPVDQLKRIVLGSLHGGQNAVFVASTVDANTIVTDVFALVDGVLTNVSASSEGGTSVKTLRNYYVYAEDIDRDGEIELPSLVTMPGSLSRSGGGEHLIRWYAMTPDGGEVDKMYTYHNYPEGWYMELTVESGSLVSVQPLGGGAYSFGLWDRKTGNITPMWLVDVLTGDDRSALAAEEGRFVLMKTDTVVYAARLEMGGRELGVTQEMLTGAFRLIRSSWYTGEM